jgi:hypothetical protein
MAWWLFATCLAVLRSSNTQLDVLTARDALSDLTSSEPRCEKTLDEITDGKVDKTLPALLRRHCASSEVIQKKEKCAGVTRLAEEALGDAEATSSGAACQRLEQFFLFVARDLQALNVSASGDTHCVHSVAEMTGTEPLPKENFTSALAKNCTVSCKEVVKMANLVLSEDRLPAADEAAVTPKLYCKLHDDYLDDIGIYDIDGLFALVFGHAEGTSTPVVASSTSSSGEYPKALQETRDENAKVFEILANEPSEPSEPQKPHSVSLAGALVLGLIFPAI